MSTAERFARFNGVGALGIVVQLATVHALVTWAASPASIATAVGVTAAVIHNFLWHCHWTWADRRIGSDFLTATFLRFALANGIISLVGNVVIVAALTATTGVGSVIANTIGIATCGLVNYWMGDRVVFRESDASARAKDRRQRAEVRNEPTPALAGDR